MLHGTLNPNGCRKTHNCILTLHTWLCNSKVNSYTLKIHVTFLQEVNDLHNKVRKLLKSNTDFIDFRSLKLKAKGEKCSIKNIKNWCHCASKTKATMYDIMYVISQSGGSSTDHSLYLDSSHTVHNAIQSGLAS